MELKLLEDYLSLCNSGNFCASAKNRFVSQPAFSRRIKALEIWVGAELIDRSSYPVQPTSAGKEFKEVAQQIISLAYQARDDIRAQSRDNEDKLYLSTLNTLAEFFIPGWLKQLKPLIDTECFSVRTDFRSLDAYLSALDEGVVDFFLCYEDQTETNLIDKDRYASLILGEESLIPVVSPDSEGNPKWWLPFPSQSPIPQLQYTSAGAHLYGLVKKHQQAHYDDLFFNTVYEASITSAIKAMAVEGYGVAWLPHSAIADELITGRLVPASDKKDTILVDIKIIKSEKKTSAKVDYFWRVLENLSLSNRSEHSKTDPGIAL